ncbi:unnamed protein product, partial [Allacma fusca]
MLFQTPVNYILNFTPPPPPPPDFQDSRKIIKRSTYGSYDPEPPRDAPIEVIALGPSLPNNTWVTAYEFTYLVGYERQPAFKNSECQSKSVGTDYKRFVGRCIQTIHGHWSSGPNNRLRCAETHHRVGPEYVPHVPQFPAGGTCGGCEAARNNTRT